jgi:hypothetical protein
MGNYGLTKVKQDLEVLGMRHIWKSGEENNRYVWREVSKRYVYIDRIWKQI